MPESPDPQRALGRAIRKRRDDLGFTQDELADRSDLHKTEIARIEGGKQNPGYATVDRIARALRWPLWRLTQLADELETADRRPTNEPLRNPPRRQRRRRPAED